MINAIEFKCYRRLLGISWRDRRTNESVKEQVEGLAAVQKPLIQIAQERKMELFGHVTRHPSELRLANTIMHGRVPGNRWRGRLRRSWIKDICEWTCSTPSQAIRLSEIKELRIIRQNQSASTWHVKGKVSVTGLERPIRPPHISGFYSMKRLGVVLLPPGWDASPSQSYPQHFRRYPFTHLGGERHQDPNPDNSIRSRAL